MNTELKRYYKFTGKSRIDKAINSLTGLIEGIAIDGIINPVEMGFLNIWLDENHDVRTKHPYNELVPILEASIADGVLNDEEREDILWLCKKLRSTEYYDDLTIDLQRLHAVMAGVAVDSVISELELRGLAKWLEEHEHLRSCWPYDEVGSIVTSVLADGKIDEQKKLSLQNFFTEFVALADNRTIVSPQLLTGQSFTGICAVSPEISFVNTKFCLTGASSKYSRVEFSGLIKRLGGVVVGSVSANLDYLIIGADGNPCWTYACYGRKVEKAVELRKQGARILLVHENDFHDALADLSIK